MPEVVNDGYKPGDPDWVLWLIDAANHAVYAYERYSDSGTPIHQAAALSALDDAMFAVKTFMPGWNYKDGTMEWGREDFDDKL